MKFVYPVALWSLLSLAILIMVHFTRRRRNEATISSIYLWRLSESFMKKSAPVRKLKKAVLFSLQILSVLLACLLIAQPLILFPGADVNYVAVLDGSASMRIANAMGETRFSRAKDAIIDDISRLAWGSRAT
ncbi:MAG: VWA domain-containing protein, partial [Clostridia bacterium]|nr:VWA domain-containing protein [Clostridia bacterium]